MRFFAQLFVAIFLTSEGAWAHTFDFETSVESSNQQTSAVGYSAMYLSEKSELLYPYSFEADSHIGLGFKWTQRSFKALQENLSFQKFALLTQIKVSKTFSIDSDVGFAHQNSILQSLLGPSLELGLNNWIQVDKFFARISFSSRYLSEAGLFSLIGGEAIRYHALRVHSLWIPDPKHRLRIQADFRFYSDDNQRVDFDAQYMYGIAPTIPWIWLGLGVSGQVNKFPSPFYWSPVRQFSIGPRFDSSLPLAHDWNLIMGVNINGNSEVGHWGWGHYSSLGLRYGKRDVATLSLQGVLNQSQQGFARWLDRKLELSAFLCF